MFSGMHKVTETNTNTPISRHRRLPSLSALRAFEAAARHSSFRMAADELNVTHSAISHQVKALEDHLSVPLFSRGGRAVHLTEEGRILFPILREAFDNIIAGTEMLRRQHSSGPLTIQVYVTLAVKWLLPRLHAFSKESEGSNNKRLSGKMLKIRGLLSSSCLFLSKPYSTCAP